jgi:hypothetical protein
LRSLATKISAATVDIEIHWPLGIVEKYPARAAGQLVTIGEGADVVDEQASDRQSTEKRLFFMELKQG